MAMTMGGTREYLIRADIRNKLHSGPIDRDELTSGIQINGMSIPQHEASYHLLEFMERGYICPTVDGKVELVYNPVEYII